jgi:ATP-dependent Clp protease ATP-binding subunit ClpB
MIREVGPLSQLNPRSKLRGSDTLTCIGQLTEYVRRKPYCIVLVDEIEKACTELILLLLQTLGDGRLTDGQNRTVDFRNTVIVMTSNLGAAHLNDVGEGPVKSQTKELVMGAIRGRFPLEFIGRINKIVIFVSIYSFAEFRGFFGLWY